MISMHAEANSGEIYCIVDCKRYLEVVALTHVALVTEEVPQVLPTISTEQIFSKNDTRILASLERLFHSIAS